jgi:hypothetical protein
MVDLRPIVDFEVDRATEKSAGLCSSGYDAAAKVRNNLEFMTGLDSLG